MRSRLCSCFLLLALAAGCSSTRQIQTAPPQPAVAATPDTDATTPHALLTVVVETGQTALPDAVQGMRFRVADVRLKPADGAWTDYPAEVNSFEIRTGQRTRKTVLSTQVPPAAYDSLALSLSDIYVQYDANAGGPLTLARDAPLRLPLAAYLAEGRSAQLRLVFEPGASLSHGDDCRWYFLPFFETLVE